MAISPHLEQHPQVLADPNRWSKVFRSTLANQQKIDANQVKSHGMMISEFLPRFPFT